MGWDGMDVYVDRQVAKTDPGLEASARFFRLLLLSTDLDDGGGEGGKDW